MIWYGTIPVHIIDFLSLCCAHNFQEQQGIDTSFSSNFYVYFIESSAYDYSLTIISLVM